MERQLQPVQGEGSQTLHPRRLQRPICKSRDLQPRGGGTSATARAGRRIPDVAPRKIAAARVLLRHRPAYCIPMSAVTAESRVRGLPGGQSPGPATQRGGTSATARAGRRIPDVAPRKIAAARLFSRCSPCSPVSPAKAGTRNREGVERQLQPVQGEGSQTLHPERLLRHRPAYCIPMLSAVTTESRVRVCPGDSPAKPGTCNPKGPFVSPRAICLCTGLPNCQPGRWCLRLDGWRARTMTSDVQARSVALLGITYISKTGGIQSTGASQNNGTAEG